MISVMVCFAMQDQNWLRELMVPPHASIREIVELSGFFKQHPAMSRVALSFGIYGEKVDQDTKANQGDRIEIYRPLTFDPKESRRRRAAHRNNQKKKGRIIRKTA